MSATGIPVLVRTLDERIVTIRSEAARFEAARRALGPNPWARRREAGRQLERERRELSVPETTAVRRNGSWT